MSESHRFERLKENLLGSCSILYQNYGGDRAALMIGQLLELGEHAGMTFTAEQRRAVGLRADDVVSQIAQVPKRSSGMPVSQ